MKSILLISLVLVTCCLCYIPSVDAVRALPNNNQQTSLQPTPQQTSTASQNVTSPKDKMMNLAIHKSFIIGDCGSSGTRLAVYILDENNIPQKIVIDKHHKNKCAKDRINHTETNVDKLISGSSPASAEAARSLLQLLYSTCKETILTAHRQPQAETKLFDLSDLLGRNTNEQEQRELLDVWFNNVDIYLMATAGVRLLELKYGSMKDRLWGVIKEQDQLLRRYHNSENMFALTIEGRWEGLYGLLAAKHDALFNAHQGHSVYIEIGGASAQFAYRLKDDLQKQYAVQGATSFLEVSNKGIMNVYYPHDGQNAGAIESKSILGLGMNRLALHATRQAIHEQQFGLGGASSPANVGFTTPCFTNGVRMGDKSISMWPVIQHAPSNEISVCWGPKTANHSTIVAGQDGVEWTAQGTTKQEPYDVKFCQDMSSDVHVALAIRTHGLNGVGNVSRCISHIEAVLHSNDENVPSLEYIHQIQDFATSMKQMTENGEKLVFINNKHLWYGCHKPAAPLTWSQLSDCLLQNIGKHGETFGAASGEYNAFDYALPLTAAYAHTLLTQLGLADENSNNNNATATTTTTTTFLLRDTDWINGAMLVMAGLTSDRQYGERMKQLYTSLEFKAGSIPNRDREDETLIDQYPPNNRFVTPIYDGFSSLLTCCAHIFCDSSLPRCATQATLSSLPAASGQLQPAKVISPRTSYYFADDASSSSLSSCPCNSNVIIDGDKPTCACN